MGIGAIGMDIARDVFQLLGVDAQGQLVLRARLARAKRHRGAAPRLRPSPEGEAEGAGADRMAAAESGGDNGPDRA